MVCVCIKDNDPRAFSILGLSLSIFCLLHYLCFAFTVVDWLDIRDRFFVGHQRYYLSMEGEMRQGQVRGHRLLRVGLLIGALLLLERHRFLRRIVRLVIGASDCTIMMRMIGDETAVHSGTRVIFSPLSLLPAWSIYNPTTGKDDRQRFLLLFTSALLCNTQIKNEKLLLYK